MLSILSRGKNTSRSFLEFENESREPEKPDLISVEQEFVHRNMRLQYWIFRNMVLVAWNLRTLAQVIHVSFVVLRMQWTEEKKWSSSRTAVLRPEKKKPDTAH
jgi:hypothetical protein